MEQSVPVVMNPRPSSRGLQAGRALISERRCYACSFCGREFRNAQALGGHMNVHRRERALANQLVELRQQPGPGDHKHKHKTGSVPGAALINPPGGCSLGEGEVVEAHQVQQGQPEQDVITHTCHMRGELPGSSSSSSSCSPPSQSSDSVDTVLRLGLATPKIL